MATQRILRGHRPPGGWLAVTVTLNGRPRTFAPAGLAGWALAGLLPLAAIWCLGATLYILFHDQFVSSLIARETDLQYAYEDRIASLRTQLESAASRGLVDRHTLDTTIRGLAEKSSLLEQRAALLDRLVARTSATDGTPGAAARRSEQTINPLLLPGPGGLDPDVRAYSGADGSPFPATAPVSGQLRLQGLPGDGANPSPRDRRSDLGTGAGRQAGTSETVAAALASAEQSQDHTLAKLRDPALRAITRFRTALAEVGLPAAITARAAARGRGDEDVGGPFVPLSAAPGALTFEQNAALVQDAVAQADRLRAVAAKIPLRKPLSGPLEVTSGYGPRIDPFLGRAAMHTGIDFRETYGDSVRATAAGTVTVAGTEGGYGTMIEIDHGNGLATRYAHLSSVSVTPGQTVSVGDVIGHVGSSGRATGPHLHYETRINGEPVDPTRFLRVGGRLYDF